jgi:hypothetical protein
LHFGRLLSGLANIMSESLVLPEMQWKLWTQILYNGMPRFWAHYYMLNYILHQELMKSLGSHGSLSWLSMTKVMV